MMQNFVSKKFAAIIFLGAILLYVPTWLWLGEAWWSDPYYSHGPLVLIISAYFFWARRHFFNNSTATNQIPISKLQAPTSKTKIASSQKTLLAMTLLLGALSVHLWATWWRAYYISALTIPVLLFTLLFALYGFKISRSFAFPLAFLFLMVPLPLAEKFGPMLEGWTALSATRFAQLIGVAAANNGAEVYLPNSAFTVGIPCAGLSSAIAILTLATLLAYIVNGSLAARIAIFLAAIPVALAANTLRLALLFAIAQQWGEQPAMDYFHSWSSPVLFLSAFALLIALAYLLQCARVRWDAILPI